MTSNQGKASVGPNSITGTPFERPRRGSKIFNSVLAEFPGIEPERWTSGEIPLSRSGMILTKYLT